MKKAWIPALFVLSGTLASMLWSTVKFPCATDALEITTAKLIPVVSCACPEFVKLVLQASAEDERAGATVEAERTESAIASVILRAALGRISRMRSPETRAIVRMDVEERKS